MHIGRSCSIETGVGRLRHRNQALAWLTAALFTVCAVMATPMTGHAADMALMGKGSFKPPSAAQLVRLPVDSSFTRSDLATGQWSFSVRYDNDSLDIDPDPHLGRYSGAIRAFRLTLGSTVIDFPVGQAQILVSDGGGGFAHRESIRVEAKTTVPSGVLRFSWIQVNQQTSGAVLSGAAGVLAGDSMPTAALVANMPTASPFDRYAELRLDPTGTETTSPQQLTNPLLYLSSSNLTVAAQAATVK